ncbi:MAG TPA: hypothetical protein VKE49_11705, partial [Myxococcaceae bacterium]|nr:hypothetical protein [Myxococcaceae bacterium]
ALAALFAIGVVSGCGSNTESGAGNSNGNGNGDSGHDGSVDSGLDAGAPDGGKPDGGADAGLDAGSDGGMDEDGGSDGGNGEDGGMDGGTGEDGGMDGGVLVSYAMEIQPIFDSLCIGCHNAITHSGNLDLSAPGSHSRLVGVPSSCNPSVMRVVPFDTAASMLWRKTAADPSRCLSPMPQPGPGLRTIAPMQFDLLEAWISQGALDN